MCTDNFTQNLIASKTRLRKRSRDSYKGMAFEGICEEEKNIIMKRFVDVSETRQNM